MALLFSHQLLHVHLYIHLCHFCLLCCLTATKRLL